MRFPIGLAVLAELLAACDAAPAPKPAAVVPAATVANDVAREGLPIGDRQRLIGVRIAAIDDEIERLARERAVVARSGSADAGTRLADLDAELARLAAKKADALRNIDNVEPSEPL